MKQIILLCLFGSIILFLAGCKNQQIEQDLQPTILPQEKLNQQSNKVEPHIKPTTAPVIDSKSTCKITSSSETAKCYAEIAIKQKDYSVCEKLPSGVRGWGVQCYTRLAVIQKDKKICESIKNIPGWNDQSTIDQCFYMVNKGEVLPFATE